MEEYNKYTGKGKKKLIQYWIDNNWTQEMENIYCSCDTHENGYSSFSQWS
jgi:hypothetical protein